ncbi:glycerol-3-phosphate acyltransferase [Phycicoccus sp. CSK15P-2]|uniref:glycerol-3-phosphate acyltransferase n=1 Tax=Phycicoccus sp. CSK15P-2 TaxID=2807627 RepID=UPI001950F150|nr:glycerol-3-phosphate acyltransferase [Phycicoccus sp. CSK15P-2]MBM6404653.1 glycerol-3-phosphate acyltransferase [Phycicoccus sp. CSK15P-2]
MPADLLVLGAVALVAFLLGAVNPATIVAGTLGRDLRSSGSGNPGAANAGRVLGRKWGVLVLVLDVAKAFAPTLLASTWFGQTAGLVAGLAVVLGHVYSPFLRGRGGKGVACAVGAVLAVEPVVAVAALVTFALAFAVVRVIGEASVLGTLAIAAVGVTGAMGLVPGVGRWTGAWLAAVAGVVVSRHRRNVRAWWSRVRG